MQTLMIAVALISFATATVAQGWNNNRIAEMLVMDLSPTGAIESGQWFTSASAPAPGTVGLGIVYAHIPGSAGSVSLHAAVYEWRGAGWTKRVDVDGLFGMSPTAAQFGPGTVDITTLMLGPGDPRCCPTLKVRWTIDLTAGTATRRY